MASQGPRYATVTTDYAVAPYNNNGWTNHDNTKANDGVYASITAPTFDSPDYSYKILSYTYGFSIPTGATINGIVVEVERRYANGIVKDALVQLSKADYLTGIGDNKSAGANWTTSDTVVTFGDANNLWGTTWTAEEINNSNFGAHFACQANGTDSDAYVDFIRITVYYTESPAHNLVPLDAYSGIPVVDKPILGQTHELVPLDAYSGVPVVTH